MDVMATVVAVAGPAPSCIIELASPRQWCCHGLGCDSCSSEVPDVAAVAAGRCSKYYPNTFETGHLTARGVEGSATAAFLVAPTTVIIDAEVVDSDGDVAHMLHAFDKRSLWEHREGTEVGPIYYRALVDALADAAGNIVLLALFSTGCFGVITVDAESGSVSTVAGLSGRYTALELRGDGSVAPRVAATDTVA